MTIKRYPADAGEGEIKTDPWRRLQRSRWLRTIVGSAILRNVALMITWLLVWQLTRLVEYTAHVSVWFPVAGLTFSVLLLDDLRTIPGLVAAGVLITLWAGYMYDLPLTSMELAGAGLLWSCAHIGSYAVGARLLRAIARDGPRELPKLVVSFLVIAAASSLLATFLGIWVLVSTGMMAAGDVATAWLPYWIGDMAGVIVLAPFFSAALGSLYPEDAAQFTATFKLHHGQASPRFKYKLMLCSVLLFGVMLLSHLTRSQNSAFAIFFLVIPYMWIACTETAFFNVLAVALASFLIALLVHVFELNEFVLIYQFAINVIAANTLFGLALPSLIADNVKLRRVAEIDTLTQAASRDCLEERARIDIMRCRETGQPLTLLVFDIDHFKQINDLFGHGMGDRALKQVSLLAQRCLRPNDMLGRVGGDEFVALLPGIGTDGALAIAERIRMQILESQLIETLRTTASFGIAQMQGLDSYETLFERADRALYRAKEQGRNRAMTLTVQVG